MIMATAVSVNGKNKTARLMQVSVTLLALLMAMFPLAGESDCERRQAMITTDRDTRQYIRSTAESDLKFRRVHSV